MTGAARPPRAAATTDGPSRSGGTTVAELERLFDAWADLLPLWNQLETINDVRFYVRLAGAMPRPSAELGVGYGRVARHVAPDYGVDLSGRMLRRCRTAVGGPTRLVKAALQTYRLPEPVAFSYAPQNLLNQVPPADRPAILRNVLANTAPGGWLALDAQLPDLAKLRRWDGLVRLRGRRGGTAVYNCAEVVDYDRLELRMHPTVERVDASGAVVARRRYPPMTFWYLLPEQVGELVRGAGWLVEKVWGGFDGEALTDRSRLQVWLLRRPATGREAG